MKSYCHNSEVVKYSDNQYYCSICLKEQNIKKSYKKLFISIFTISLLFTIIGTKAPNIDRFTGNYNIYKENDISLNDSCVFNELLKQDILFPEYALKSAIYESGHFKSRICREGNNIFGITKVNNKLQIGEIKGQEGLKFGKYASVRDCIKHYKQIQLNYSRNIDRRYSNNKSYTVSILKIK